MITALDINLTNPVNKKAYLNIGLVSWYLGLPQWSGGNTWHDLMRLNNITLSNGATWKPANKLFSNSCLSLDGSNDFAQAADSSSLDLTNNFSICLWVRKTVSGTSMSLITKGSGGYEIDIDSGTTLRFNRDNSSVLISRSWSDNGNWNFVGMSKLGSNLSLCLNGNVTTASSATAIDATTRVLVVGGDDTTPTKPFNGLIDDIRIYKRPLSAAQLINLYYAGKNGYIKELNRISYKKYSLPVSGTTHNGESSIASLFSIADAAYRKRYNLSSVSQDFSINNTAKKTVSTYSSMENINALNNSGKCIFSGSGQIECSETIGVLGNRLRLSSSLLELINSFNNTGYKIAGGNYNTQQLFSINSSGFSIIKTSSVLENLFTVLNNSSKIANSPTAIQNIFALGSGGYKIAGADSDLNSQFNIFPIGYKIVRGNNNHEQIHTLICQATSSGLVSCIMQIITSANYSAYKIVKPNLTAQQLQEINSYGYKKASTTTTLSELLSIYSNAHKKVFPDTIFSSLNSLGLSPFKVVKSSVGYSSAHNFSCSPYLISSGNCGISEIFTLNNSSKLLKFTNSILQNTTSFNGVSYIRCGGIFVPTGIVTVGANGRIVKISNATLACIHTLISDSSLAINANYLLELILGLDNQYLIELGLDNQIVLELSMIREIVDELGLDNYLELTLGLDNEVNLEV